MLKGQSFQHIIGKHLDIHMEEKKQANKNSTLISYIHNLTQNRLETQLYELNLCNYYILEEKLKNTFMILNLLKIS